MRNLVFAVFTATTLVLAGGATAADFTLSSADFSNNGTMKAEQSFNGFGCSGANISPALSWSNAPAGTKSFVVTAYDPDAPTGSGWWHWVVFNIPASVHSLPAGISKDPAKLPAGVVESNTDFGEPGYGGPCPPEGHGPHRYVFTVHALKVDKLDVPASAPAAMVGFNLWANTIAKTSTTGIFERKK